MNLCFVFGNQTSLHIAAQAFNSSSTQNTFRSATLTNVHMHAAAFDAAFNNRVNIAVGKQGDTCACFTDFVHQAVMTFAVQQNYVQVAYFTVHCFSNACQVFADRSIDIDAAFSTGADSDFIHVHIRSMQQAATRSDSNNCDSAVLSFSNQVGTFNRVNSDINLRAAGTYFFADIQHRCFIHFAFADNNGTFNIYGIKGCAHSVNSQTVSTVLVASAYKMTAGNSCSLGYTYKFQRKLSVHSSQHSLI